MGGRRPLLFFLLLLFFLPFLALAATGAGLPGTGLADSAPQRPTRAVALQSPFPGGPQPSAGPRDGSGAPSTSTEPPPDPPERRSPELASEAPMVDGRQTRPQTHAEEQMGARTSEWPYTANPPFTPTMATMMPSRWTVRPTWAPLASLPAHTSLPASPGAPAVGTEVGGSEVLEASAPSLLALGSRGPLLRQASWTGTEPLWSPRPGQEAAKGPTGAVDQAATSVSAEKSESPITEPAWFPAATNPKVQEAEAPSEETLGTPPVSAWQLLFNTSKPGPSRLPMLPGASGPDRDTDANATEWAQPLPHTGNGVLLLAEGRMPQELPGGHTDSGELLPHWVGGSRPPKDRSPGGPSSPWPALAESPKASSASPTGLGQVGGRRGEATLPSRSLGSPQGPPTPDETLAFQETKPPRGRPSAREGQGEMPLTAPFRPSSAQGGAPLPVFRWGSSIPSLAEEPPASPRAPGGTSTSLPWTPDWRSAGQPSRVDQEPLHSPTWPPTVTSPAPSPVGILPESPSTTPGKEQGSPEGSGSQADAGELLPSPPGTTEASSLATGAPQTSFLWGEGLRGVPTDSVDVPHQVTAEEGGPQQAWEGTWGKGPATETARPPSRGSPGRREEGHLGQDPPWTGRPVGLAPSSSSTAGVLSVGPSRPPGLPSESMATSAQAPQTVAASTSQMGGTAGWPSPPSVARHLPWPFSTRTWRWEEGSQPRNPTETQRKGVVHPSLGPAGTTLATLAESPGGGGSGSRNSWPPWPPTPTSELGTLRSRGGPRSATTQLGPPAPREGHPRGHQPVLVVENQPPLLKASFLPVPCELVLAMAFSRSFRDPGSPEYRHLVGTINETVTPRLSSLPGFLRLEVKALRPGSVVVEFDALFWPQAPGLWAALSRSALSERLPPGLLVGNASVLRSVTQERRLDLCALLFSCHTGYECLAQEDGGALCVSLCHRDYCKNQGICLHVANHTPVCQCPVGHDFWFLGVHCDYKVTQQGLLGAACGLLLSLVALGVVVAGLVIRRVRLLLLEAKADQTKSSYRRFCRLDDVSAHYWSEPWLASTTSLDNPAFSNSEELLHLQRLEGPACFGCPEEDGRGPGAPCGQTPDTPRGLGAVGQRPSCRYNWAESLSSLNDPMVDSGKASEVSVSSWPMEPLQWSPLPALHKLPRDQGEARAAPRPDSCCCEATELVNLERSWTA